MAPCRWKYQESCYLRGFELGETTGHCAVVDFHKHVTNSGARLFSLVEGTFAGEVTCVSRADTVRIQIIWLFLTIVSGSSREFQWHSSIAFVFNWAFDCHGNQFGCYRF